MTRPPLDLNSAFALRRLGWCHLGQACEKLEDWEGAEYAYRQARGATTAGPFDTDAADRLAEHLARRRPTATGVTR